MKVILMLISQQKYTCITTWRGCF